MTTVNIESDVPVPQTKSQWHPVLLSLEVGQSFKADSSSALRVRQIVYDWHLRGGNEPRRFVTKRRADGALRVWRVM